MTIEISEIAVRMRIGEAAPGTGRETPPNADGGQGEAVEPLIERVVAESVRRVLAALKAAEKR